MTKSTTRPTPLWQQVVAIGAYLLGTCVIAISLILLATGNADQIGSMVWGLFQFVAWAIGGVTLVAGLFWLVFQVLPRLRREGTHGEHRVPRKAHIVTRPTKTVTQPAHKGTSVAQSAPAVLLDLGGGRMKRSDAVTQAGITDLIVRAKKEEAVTWREQLLELDAQLRANVTPDVTPISIPIYQPIGEGEIETWLEGITPDRVAYPFKAKRNLVALMKSYRAKQRSEGWNLVRTTALPHPEDASVPTDFDPSTAQHGLARVSTDIISTGQHGENDANTTPQVHQASSSNTQKRSVEADTDSDTHGGQESIGAEEGGSDTGTVGETSRVQQLLALGE